MDVYLSTSSLLKNLGNGEFFCSVAGCSGGGAVFTGWREFFAYLSAVWAPRHCGAAINLGMRIRL